MNNICNVWGLNLDYHQKNDKFILMTFAFVFQININILKFYKRKIFVKESTKKE